MTILRVLLSIIKIFGAILKTSFMSKKKIELENQLLKTQLAHFQRRMKDGKIPKYPVDDKIRIHLACLCELFNDLKSSLVLVTPETVKRWHTRLFKFFWRKKSEGGRPKISKDTIAMIKRIHKENPLLSPEKIHEMLVALNIMDAPSPNTIAKYIPKMRKPPTEKQRQSWRTFLHNHRKNIWSMDFATVTTLLFKVYHILFIVSHDRRKIEHFAVIENPNANWMEQQIRNATPYGKQPRHLIHDNASVFKEKHFQKFLKDLNIKSKSIAPHSPWQNGVTERPIGTVRRGLLDHVIPFNQRHLECLLKEYVDYYNNHRTHQALDCDTPEGIIQPKKSLISDTKLISKPVLGGLYHYYEKVA
ncbi:MAG: integrase core domain-containing protein [Defluviitaleaceae bacterium]|nr:integrase core domain-containing protein [Defluviitaleaceae bacterium]